MGSDLVKQTTVWSRVSPATGNKAYIGKAVGRASWSCPGTNRGSPYKCWFPGPERKKRKVCR